MKKKKNKSKYYLTDKQKQHIKGANSKYKLALKKEISLLNNILLSL